MEEDSRTVIVPGVSFSQRRRERENDQKDRCGEEARYLTLAFHVPDYTTRLRSQTRIKSECA